MEDKIVTLRSEDIITMLENVANSGAYAILRRILNVLDNCGQLAARLPHSVVGSCYKFYNSNNVEPGTILDIYNLCMSNRYHRALNKLVTYVQHPHIPMLGVNQINSLIKNTGLSLHKFTGFAQVEGHVEQEKAKDVNYPSQLDLLGLCGQQIQFPEMTHGQITYDEFNVYCTGAKITINGEQHERMLELKTVTITMSEVDLEISPSRIIDLQNNVELEKCCIENMKCLMSIDTYLVLEKPNRCKLAKIRSLVVSQLQLTHKGKSEFYLFNEEMLPLSLPQLQRTERLLRTQQRMRMMVMYWRISWRYCRKS